MSRERDRELREAVGSEVERISLAPDTSEKLLTEIHRQIGERRTIMKYPRKRVIAMIAAAIMVTGTITAIAAGKIVAYRSSVSLDEAFTSIEELKKEAAAKLGDGLVVAETLADGSAFSESFVTMVDRIDDSGNVASSYPEVMLSYGSDRGINVTISREADIDHEGRDGMRQETTEQGIVLQAWEDSYLFLPPDAEPSEEDRALEAAGKLFISYGSEKEERQVFKYVQWTDGGFSYGMSTFQDVNLDELLELAKGYLAGR